MQYPAIHSDIFLIFYQIISNRCVPSLWPKTYHVDSVKDVVMEAAKGGTDTMVLDSGFSFNYTLGANVENLTMSGSHNINGTGNGLTNTIICNDDDNVLNGGAGKDVFTFTSTSDSTNGAADRITDFQNGSDKIDLSATGIDSAHLSYHYDDASDTGTLSNSASSFAVELADVHELADGDVVLA
jgi:Ca2+-binding RTX toxin-like protein